MKVVMAIDSFKGSLSSMDAGRAAAQGIQRVDPQVQVQVRPLADGGEGNRGSPYRGNGGTFPHGAGDGTFWSPGGLCVWNPRGK